MDDGLGGSTADAGVLGAKVRPAEAEVLVCASVVDIAKAHGLSVGTFGGDHGESLLSAG